MTGRPEIRLRNRNPRCRTTGRHAGAVSRRDGKIAARLVAGTCLLAAAAAALTYTRSPGRRSSDGLVAGQASPAEIEALRPQVTLFCGNCHAVPSPLGFP